MSDWLGIDGGPRRRDSTAIVVKPPPPTIRPPRPRDAAGNIPAKYSRRYSPALESAVAHLALAAIAGATTYRILRAWASRRSR